MSKSQEDYKSYWLSHICKSNRNTSSESGNTHSYWQWFMVTQLAGRQEMEVLSRQPGGHLGYYLRRLCALIVGCKSSMELKESLYLSTDWACTQGISCLHGPSRPTATRPETSLAEVKESLYCKNSWSESFFSSGLKTVLQQKDYLLM